MTVSVLDAWSANIVGANPSGPILPSAGASRICVVKTCAERDSYSVTEFSIDDELENFQFEVIETSLSPDLIIRYHVWLEARIAAFTSGAVTAYNDGIATPGTFSWQWASYQDCNQASPIFNTAYNASVDDLAPLTVVSPGVSGDRNLVAGIRAASARSFGTVAGLNEILDVAITTTCRAGLFEGNGGTDPTSVPGGDTILAPMLLASIILEQGAAPLINSVSIDDVMEEGETATIDGSGFEAAQGAGVVKISPTDNVADGAAVEQSVTSWADDSIDFIATRGGTLNLDDTLYLFVTNDGGGSNAAGHTISFEPNASVAFDQLLTLLFTIDVIVTPPDPEDPEILDRTIFVLADDDTIAVAAEDDGITVAADDDSISVAAEDDTILVDD